MSSLQSDNSNNGGGTKRSSNLNDDSGDGIDQPKEGTNDKNTLNTKKRRLDETKAIPNAPAAAVNGKIASIGSVPTSAVTTTAPTAATTASCSTSTLYVSNLHPRISEPHLEKLFVRFGDINRVHLIRKMISSGGGSGSTGRSTSTHPSKVGTSRSRQQQQQSSYSFAFVEFKTVQAASTAMTKLNGVSLLGKDLVVRPAHGKSENNNFDGYEKGTGEGGSKDGAGAGGTTSATSMRKQRNDVESKIDAVKRALQEKMKKR